MMKAKKYFPKTFYFLIPRFMNSLLLSGLPRFSCKLFKKNMAIGADFTFNAIGFAWFLDWLRLSSFWDILTYLKLEFRRF